MRKPIFRARVSLKDRLIATDGRPSGFDYLRLGLAIAVIITHSATTSYRTDSEMWHSPLRPLLRAILPMFFALSGFLVAGSLERSKTLLTFLGLRVIRIYPALAVEVVLSACLIGAAVTNFPLTDYFRDPLFLTYLRNVVGDVHFYLPGVFEDNPLPRVVNGQLWTVPVELICYLTLSGTVLFAGVRRKMLVPIATLGLILAHLVLRMHKYNWHFPPLCGGFSGPLLVVCFLLGVSMYFYRDKIAWSSSLAAAAVVPSTAFLWFVPFGDYPGAITITYITIYLGLTDFKRVSIIRGADYSYGIYLYGFVIQQLFVYLVAPQSWWVNSLVCLPSAALVAAFSWHFVEKPAQKLRRPLMRAEQSYLASKARLLASLRPTKPA